MASSPEIRQVAETLVDEVPGLYPNADSAYAGIVSHPAVVPYADLPTAIAAKVKSGVSVVRAGQFLIGCPVSATIAAAVLEEICSPTEVAGVYFAGDSTFHSLESLVEPASRKLVWPADGWPVTALGLAGEKIAIVNVRNAVPSSGAPFRFQVIETKFTPAEPAPSLAKGSLASERGAAGEAWVEKALAAAGFGPADVSRRARSGDFRVMTPAGAVLVEVKNYQSTVPRAEVAKFRRDLGATGAAAGVFVSLGSRVPGGRGGPQSSPLEVRLEPTPGGFGRVPAVYLTPGPAAMAAGRPPDPDLVPAAVSLASLYAEALSLETAAASTANTDVIARGVSADVIARGVSADVIARGAALASAISDARAVLADARVSVGSALASAGETLAIAAASAKSMSGSASSGSTKKSSPRLPPPTSEIAEAMANLTPAEKNGVGAALEILQPGSACKISGGGSRPTVATFAAGCRLVLGGKARPAVLEIPCAELAQRDKASADLLASNAKPKGKYLTYNLGTREGVAAGIAQLQTYGG